MSDTDSTHRQRRESSDDHPAYPLGEYYCPRCNSSFEITGTSVATDDPRPVSCPICSESDRVQCVDAPTPVENVDLGLDPIDEDVEAEADRLVEELEEGR